MNGIGWVDGAYTTKRGSVNGNHFFTIAWKSTREDPNWVLSCSLPVLEGRRWKDDDQNVLREQAQTVLDDWLKRMFGIRPAGDEDPAFRAWYERADIGPDLEWCAVEGFMAGWRARAGETS